MPAYVSNSALISTWTTHYKDDCFCFSAVKDFPKERPSTIAIGMYMSQSYSKKKMGTIMANAMGKSFNNPCDNYDDTLV